MKRTAFFPLSILLVCLLAPSACPPKDVNYKAMIHWGDHCADDQLSMDVYELIVDGFSQGENPPRSTRSAGGFIAGRKKVTIRLVPKAFSAYCGKYFIALEGGATFEDGSEFVTAKMDLTVETEHNYIVIIPNP